MYSLSKKLVFLPVASAMAGSNRDCPVLASDAQWPEIQPLVSRGQIVSTDLPLQTHGWTLICSGLQLAKQLDLQEDIVRVIGRFCFWLLAFTGLMREREQAN